MTLAEAQALMADRGPRHGLVVISAESWDGTVARDPYLTARLEPRRATPAPLALGTQTRVRAIRTVRDIPPEQRAQIAADGKQIGPEATGRKWNVSKWSVQQVMKLAGLMTPSHGRWKSDVYARCGRRFFHRD